MQDKHSELVPIGEVFGGLDGPVKALIPSPQALHHFTQADQVNQLVSASEADPDLGFMARMMALCRHRTAAGRGGGSAATSISAICRLPSTGTSIPTVSTDSRSRVERQVSDP